MVSLRSVIFASLLVSGLNEALGNSVEEQSDLIFPDVTSVYYTNEEMKQHMERFTMSPECGNISRMFRSRNECQINTWLQEWLHSIGKSGLGVDLWVLEISDSPGKHEAKPNFKYVANMHGDEPSGRQLLLKLALWLCQNWKTDSRAKVIVKDMHLFILPSMNPDGFELKQRENSQGVDLNRDFPDRFKIGENGMGPTGKEVPETRAMMNWIMGGFFTASANLHEGELVANYPWDGTRDTPNEVTRQRYKYEASPDDATFKYLASVYANSHSVMHKSEKFAGGVTNGNAWYTVHGSMQDYNYIAGNCMDLTLELSMHKHPPASVLEDLWDENKNALLDYAITATLGSFRGYVRSTGRNPLAAVIHVKGLEKDYHTRAEFGDFYRPLHPGKYNVTISAEGFRNFSARISIPSKGVSHIYAITLTDQKTASGLRVVDAGTPVATGHKSWTPDALIALLVAVFLVIGIQRVYQISKVETRL